MTGDKALGHLRPRPGSQEAPRRSSQPARHTVTLVPGDGIGEELAEIAVGVVEASGASIAWERRDAGHKAMARHGTPLPQPLIDSLRATRTGLLGRLAAPAGGGPPPNVALRKRIGLFASVRPARSVPGLPTRYPGLDLVIVRENTEDIYAGIEHEVVPGVIESLRVITAAASSRIARFAFDLAARQGRRSVAAVHKANIMKRSDGLFLECCRAAAAESPSIAYREVIADNAVLQLVRDPGQFDVLLAGNMFGDILADLCAGLAGGPGTVPAIHHGEGMVVVEAVHGNAPHLEGQDRANPLTMLLPAAALLDHLGEREAAGRIAAGIAAAFAAGAVTPDLGGSARTSEMARAIMDGMPG
ncbi:MAG TPA: isocitrate/isopropylmalate family dehydrogenase [Candidatus Polarisedimenticolia bacterium]|nr:isocitrate/isopropylmalate family dehydrogenase [Candidatus Polarisedimenticolia bacterium]